MHSFLIALAYMAMVFAPCAAAQWGDVLMRPYCGLDFGFFAARRQRRFGMMDPLLAMVQRQREAAEFESLTDSVFIRPTAFRAAAPRTFAEAMQQATPKRAASLEKAAALVARRLAALAEAHRLANTVVAAEPDVIVTPTPAELEALYAYERPLPQVLVTISGPPERDTGNQHDHGTNLHLLPAVLGNSPPRVAETPPISVAA